MFEWILTSSWNTIYGLGKDEEDCSMLIKDVGLRTVR